METVARVQDAQQAAQRAAVAQALGQGLKQAGDQIAGAQTDRGELFSCHPFSRLAKAMRWEQELYF